MKLKINDVIVIDDDILGGTPVFKGTRVPIKNLFDYMEAGDSLNNFLADFDQIRREWCVIVLRTSEKLLTTIEIEYQNKKKSKTSDFRGKLNLTEEQHNDFQTHITNIRNEWDV